MSLVQHISPYWDHFSRTTMLTRYQSEHLQSLIHHYELEFGPITSMADLGAEYSARLCAIQDAFEAHIVEGIHTTTQNDFIVVQPARSFRGELLHPYTVSCTDISNYTHAIIGDDIPLLTTGHVWYGPEGSEFFSENLVSLPQVLLYTAGGPFGLHPVATLNVFGDVGSQLHTMCTGTAYRILRMQQ